ncbi:MAG: DNA polymerase IV [Coriobacteriia bacterium]|nr:DNA polymerase IV [Coriobacteriia bacterium]MBN2823077.1 DNA polymerase IV [Coriobacteriia bacterium]
MDDTLHFAWAGRAIMHLDMDAFFAAVEQLDHPEWRGRPVIVGGSPDGRGVVSTASYEARVFGVHSAMPAAQAARLCPSAIWARPRFSRYEEISRSVRDIMRDVTPYVHPTSIDEAYLDITPGVNGVDPVNIARRIQADVARLGVTCSIGLATSRTVAKIASEADKPRGLTVVRPGAEPGFLAPMPVKALPGVGRATEERLRTVGVRTLGDLAALDERSADQLLGSHGIDLVMRARGIDARPVSGGSERKSVSAEHTFRSDIRTREEVEAELRRLVERVARRMRAHGLSGRTFTVKLRYADFSTRTVSRTVAVPADIDADILPVAVTMLSEVWTPGAGLRLLGFGVAGFGQQTQQLELLDESVQADTSKPRALVEGLDRIKERFGDDVLGFGVRGLRAPIRENKGEEDDDPV